MYIVAIHNQIMRWNYDVGSLSVAVILVKNIMYIYVDIYISEVLIGFDI